MLPSELQEQIRDVVGDFALAEPHTGSDAPALRTRARRDGDATDGTKQPITSGRSGQIVIRFAVTDPDAGKKGLRSPTKRPPERSWSSPWADRQPVRQCLSGVCNITLAAAARSRRPMPRARSGSMFSILQELSKRRAQARAGGLRELRDENLANPWKRHDNIPL